MDNGIRDRIIALDGAAPRYTSYPPATAFQVGFPDAAHMQWLARVDSSKPISLYVHIPFCPKLCFYCGCATNIANKPEMVASYLDQIEVELALLSRRLPHNVTVSMLHFGGGSPTMLMPAQFARLMTNIMTYFALEPDAEIAIEADPRHLNEARIATYARHGVNRLSLGVQSFDMEVLRTVNRPQPYHLTWNAVQTCREYGIEQINIDLMYGLPGQNIESITGTISAVLPLKPDRIAYFGYAHVPWMKKHMVMLSAMPLPDAALRYDLYSKGSEMLCDAGYLPVGIDHFVRPTDTMARALGNRRLRRNFQGYTVDAADTLIGIGASAISNFREGYTQNIVDIARYRAALSTGELPLAKGYVLTEDDKMRARIISQILCYMAVDLAEFNAEHCLFAASMRLQPLLDAGLARREGTFIRVMHPLAARMVAACFDPATSQPVATPRHANAV
jgi:oxygen-independent coproporphyrinogen-3 oxidase